MSKKQDSKENRRNFYYTALQGKAEFVFRHGFVSENVFAVKGRKYYLKF